MIFEKAIMQKKRCAQNIKKFLLPFSQKGPKRKNKSKK